MGVLENLIGCSRQLTAQRLTHRRSFIFAALSFAIAGTLAEVAVAACMRPTVYFKPISDRPPYSSCKSRENLTIRDDDRGRSFKTSVCPRFVRDAKIQGQATITFEGERRVINVSGRASQIWKLIPKKQCSYGYGVKNLCLIPFVSIAADLRHHKAGDVIFVKALKGTKVPNPLQPSEWWTHDGYVVITDRGGAINGSNRFDFFIGTSDWQSDNFPWRDRTLMKVNPGQGFLTLVDKNHCKMDFQKVTGDLKRKVLAKYDHLLNQAR